MTSRSEIRTFADTHFGGPGNMAAELDITSHAIKKWDDKPELMLKYLLLITELTDCTVMDVVEAVESQRKANGKHK